MITAGDSIEVHGRVRFNYRTSKNALPRQAELRDYGSGHVVVRVDEDGTAYVRVRVIDASGQFRDQSIDVPIRPDEYSIDPRPPEQRWMFEEPIVNATEEEPCPSSI